MKKVYLALSAVSVVFAGSFAHATIGPKISCTGVEAKDQAVVFNIDSVAQTIEIVAEGASSGLIPAIITNDGTNLKIDQAFYINVTEKDGKITGVLKFWSESALVCKNI